MRVPLVYRDAPQLGLDIGRRSVKLLQLSGSRHHPKLVGYASAPFASDAIVEGIITDPEVIAAAIKEALKHTHAGKLTARRIATGLPASKTFTRTLTLPDMKQADLEQAVSFEVEQYVPVPLSDLYIDHEIIGRTHDDQGDHLEVLMVAAPRAIVDSYIKLFDLMHLELASVETNTSAALRALIASKHLPSAVLVMDVGSESTDMAVTSSKTRLNATAAIGGEQLTASLIKKLSIKPDQATEIKAKFGLSKSGMQDKIVAALNDDLQAIVREAKKVLKFYADRGDSEEPVEAIVLAGGTATMPGLADYFHQQFDLPVQIADPWQSLAGRHLDRITPEQHASFTTAIGLAMTGLES